MSMTTTWTLGELIAKARKDAGLDQAQLARAIGIARNSLSNYETGRSVPPFDVATRIAAVCGVALDWFASAVNVETASADAEAVLDDGAPEGTRTPNLLIGSQIDVEYELLCIAEGIAL